METIELILENNTSNSTDLSLFNTATLTNIPISGSNQNTYTPSNDFLPSLPPSQFALNPTNGTFIASSLTTPTLSLINSTNNTNENEFDNSDAFDFVVNEIAIQSNGKIIVGGSFQIYKSVAENYIIRLNPDGSKDTSFDNSVGFDFNVLTIAIQSDGKILVGGAFTTYKGLTENYIIRLNPNGSKDITFDNLVGFDAGVDSIAIQSDGKILVGGIFTTYKGVSANNIIRLNPDGSKDTSFDNSIGFNFTVNSVAIQSDGKILVGGAFTTYKGLTENYIIRLNPNGSKDTSFDNSVGFDAGVNSIAIQSDGKILVGGNFTTYKGLTENYIIRLNPDGSKDTSFDNSVGFDNSVISIAIQSDGKILVGGIFTTYKGVSANRIIRLNPNGTKDITFDNSVAFGGSVGSIAIQSDGKIFCGGGFVDYNGYSNSCIILLNTNGGSASTLNNPLIFNTIQYNSFNNVFYASDNFNTYQISSDGQVISLLSGNGATSLSYNSNNNSLYGINLNSLNITDCLTFVSNILSLPNNSSGLSSVTPLNKIYFFDDVTGFLQKIDCSTNTLDLINLALPNITSNVNSITYNNGYLYITSSTSNIIDVVNTNTDTYFTSITIPAIYSFLPNYVGVNPTTNQLFISDSNPTNPKQYAVVDFSSNNVVVNSLGGIGATYGVFYNSITNTMYVSGSLFSVTVITPSPVVIGGSTNYNAFVNNLNNEPILISSLRIVAQNQQQLYNEVQFTRIDSNGNQIIFSEFPILKVDSNQEQGNIAEIKLDNIIFDGNTYISNYIVNPNQTVNLEIKYNQLNLFNVTKGYPIFFKEKVQLKQYIKEDYSDYDISL
jgi:uncharacterized delta-60 repeat protein